MKTVLCLHGYTQNGSLFARKASAIRKALAKAGYESYFLSGPISVSPSDLDFAVEEGASDMLSWWPTNEHDPKYYKLGDAFQTIKDAVETAGPFEGVLGFSQGAGLAAVVTRHLPELVPSHPPLKFAVLYSGFKLKPEEYAHFYDPKLSTPSLHVIGTLDTIVSEERSMALYDACENPQILKHPGGHYVPSQKPVVEAVMAFIKSTESPLSPSDEDSASDWDQFDKIGGN
ncbi:Dihydrofolate reductase [Wickerhamiella sorbophila]|uniref:Dihydrofolate reductase n=1 Tax=Wickerhamiella sorbophila TaxID=45607 RepID=A0A2T0FKR7_9ASCO|nr:Dihydrofolate reductase [Wickerhamiella sorbophila]PRT55578.1 Dihydrofolate reductase [Wickerhamiella sorbophila]